MLISLDNASKSYGDIHAFKNITLSIKQGEIIALVGPNGSGKTTLLRAIVGLTAFDNNEPQQVLHARPPIGIAERRRLLYVPDDDSLIDNITPLEYFGLVANVYAAPVERIKIAIKMLRELDFDTNRLNNTLKTYSHGMRKKVQLATLCIPQAELIIVDEPTNGLDPTAVILLRQALQKVASNKTTLLLSTHNLAFAEQVAQRVVLMKNQLLYDGTVTSLLRQTTSKSLEDAYTNLVITSRAKNDKS